MLLTLLYFITNNKPCAERERGQTTNQGSKESEPDKEKSNEARKRHILMLKLLSLCRELEKWGSDTRPMMNRSTN